MLKRPLILALFIGLMPIKNLLANGNPSQIDSLMNLSPSNVQKISDEWLRFPYVKMEMDFNSSHFINDYSSLLNDQFTRVEEIILVWTAYRLSETFSQPELNRKRLENLRKLYPKIINSKGIRWKFVVQTGATTEDEARNCYHGFLMKLNAKPSLKKTPDDDLLTLKKILALETVKDSVVGFTTKVRCKKVPTGKFLPKNKKKRKQGILYDHAGIWQRRKERVKKCDTLIVPLVKQVSLIDTLSPVFLNRDSTVSSLLVKNKDWKNSAVVCDVTGSMSPFYADLILWIKMNADSTRFMGYTFFNDGDRKPDHAKQIGKTGGIYHCRDFKATQAVNTLTQATSAGSGGDQPENNIEALISAAKTFPQAISFVMIGDGVAPVKDISLVNQVKKPVHIIACGNLPYVHPDYAELAYKTKGSIQNLSESINFAEIKEDDEFTFGGLKYRIQNGQLSILQYL